MAVGEVTAKAELYWRSAGGGGNDGSSTRSRGYSKRIRESWQRERESQRQARGEQVTLCSDSRQVEERQKRDNGTIGKWPCVCFSCRRRV